MSQWEFTKGDASARLTIGSNPSCQWVVSDASVEPFHLVVSWSGETLSVAGSRDSVALSLDGNRVGTSFVPVPARSRIEFGHCAIVVETSPVRRSKPASGPALDAALGSLPPNKRTLLGVAALSGPPPGGSSDAPAARPAEAPRPSPSNDPKATAIGMAAVVPRAPRAPSEAEPTPQASERPRSDRPHSNTTYGIGEVRDTVAVDVVSPSQLRRTSVAPGGASANDEGPAGPEHERRTAPGFEDSDEQPAESLAIARRQRDATPTDTRLAYEQPAGHPAPPGRPGANARPEGEPSVSGAYDSVDPKPESPSAGEVRAAWRSRSQQMSAEFSAVPPPQFRPSGPPRARGPRPMTIVIALVTLAGLGVWLYALTTL